MNRKAVFFDADGTLCDMEKGVPQSTKEALKKLRENGHGDRNCNNLIARLTSDRDGYTRK